MTRCPVCGKRVDVQHAPTTEYKGQTYHFACAHCQAAFAADPEQFLGRREHD